MTTRANYSRVNHGAFEALSAVNKQLTALDPKLRALVELRVSQINGCVYCVDLHSNQARGHGETQQRLDRLCAWESAFVAPARFCESPIIPGPSNKPLHRPERLEMMGVAPVNTHVINR